MTKTYYVGNLARQLNAIHDPDQKAACACQNPMLPTLLLLLLLLCELLLRRHAPQLEGAAVIQARKLEAICGPAQACMPRQWQQRWADTLQRGTQ